MLLAEILFALGLALLFTAIFTLGFKRIGPWAVWWIFFLIIFMTAWAGSLWITPVGPMLWGIYFLPIIVVALVAALLLAAVTPPDRRGRKIETISQVKKEAMQRKSLMFFYGFC